MHYLETHKKNLSLHYRIIYNCLILYIILYIILPIPVDTWSKAWMCGHSFARIPGSNPARGNGYVSCVLCSQVEVSAMS